MKEKLKHLRKHPKTPAILTAIMFTGVSFAAVHNLPNPPVFPNTDNFVIFAEQNVSFEESATISSGDVGTNGTLSFAQNGTANGNLFADKIALAKGTTINGNANYNKISNNPPAGGEILGTKTTSVSLPIANLPVVQPFAIGTEDKTFSGNANTLPSGNYKNIIVQKDSTLTLSGGTYNLNILDLKERSTLIFTTETTINIQFKLRGRDNVSILNGQNAKPEDLHINYVGMRNEQGNDRTKEQGNDKTIEQGNDKTIEQGNDKTIEQGNDGAMEQDDENEVMAFLDKQEKTDCQNRKIGRPIVFGKNSFLNFALLAPKANVIIGKDGTMRGQVLARKAKIGKNAIVSKDEVFSQPTDLSKIVTVDGEKYPVNEIIVVLEDIATFSDAKLIANYLHGSIVGFIPSPQIYKIKVSATSVAELDASISNLQNQNNPLVLFISKNIMSGIQ